MLLHETLDFADLVAVTARAHGIDPGLVEKDYWIMHGLWGLQIVRNVLFPGGCVIVALWLVATLRQTPIRIREIVWWVSVLWHSGWLAYLLLTIFGFLGLLHVAPLLLGWLVLALGLSAMAVYDVRAQHQDAQQDMGLDAG